MQAARIITALALMFAATAPASAQQVDPSPGSVIEIVKNLRPGQFVWAPHLAPEGPTFLIVNVKTQRAVLYRNGVPIAASTASTGRPGYETPTGVFTILQKRVRHFSAKYDNAPMPYMQRLTWYGVALHAGNLPGRPASHGCIRLPLKFAELLYGATKVGMTVMITSSDTSPRLMPSTRIDVTLAAGRRMIWNPEASPVGPVSIIVSAPDRMALILRNGIEIGSGPVRVLGKIEGTWAYTVRESSPGLVQWFRIPLSLHDTADQVPRDEWQRFEADPEFKRAVASVIRPGTTIVVTADSLQQGASRTALTVIEAGATEP